MLRMQVVRDFHDKNGRRPYIGELDAALKNVELIHADGLEM